MAKCSQLFLGALAVVGVSAACRSVAPAAHATHRDAAAVESPADTSDGRPIPADVLDVVVEVVPLRHARPETLVLILRSAFADPRRVQYRENSFCTLVLPEVLNRPVEPRWTVDVDVGRNAIVLRGTAEQVARLRNCAEALDGRLGAGR